MNSKSFFYVSLILTILFFSAGASFAQHGMMHNNRGMMGQYGHHNDYQYNTGRTQGPVDQKQAEGIVRNYLTNLDNPNLKAGKITDQGSNYEVEILTKDNSLVNKILIEKQSGQVSSLYGNKSYSQSSNHWNFCPYCGNSFNRNQYRMGPGMMYNNNYHMNGNMNHGRGMMHRGMMQRGYGTLSKPLEKNDAEKIFKNYLENTRNPNLKLGSIKETDSGFEAEIVTKKDGSLVDKMRVDKQTGWFGSVY